MSEIFKYLCKKSSSKKRIFSDEDDIDKLLVLSNNHAKEEKRMEILKEDIRAVAYEEELIESEFISMYEEKKILIEKLEQLMDLLSLIMDIVHLENL